MHPELTKLAGRAKNLRDSTKLCATTFAAFEKAANDAVDRLEQTIAKIDKATENLKNEKETVDERNDYLEKVLDAEIDAFLPLCSKAEKSTETMAYMNLLLQDFGRTSDQIKSVKIEKAVEPPKPPKKSDPNKAAKILGIKDVDALRKAMDAAWDGDEDKAEKLLGKLAQDEQLKDKPAILMKELANAGLLPK